MPESNDKDGNVGSPEEFIPFFEKSLGGGLGRDVFGATVCFGCHIEYVSLSGWKCVEIARYGRRRVGERGIRHFQARWSYSGNTGTLIDTDRCIFCG